MRATLLALSLLGPVAPLLLRPPSHSVQCSQMVLASRRCAAPVANLFPEDWMNRLGTATASKKKWAIPLPDSSLGAGSVLFANPGSFDHYFLESMVLITEHSDAGSKGVLLTHETPWKVEDMNPGAILPFAASTVFLGGDAGRDTMVMVHGESELPGATELGRGVYQGGVDAAVRAVELGALPSSRFKFFYKSVEWLPNALQDAIDTGVFRKIELSPSLLFGQWGTRSTWGDVHEMLKKEDAAQGVVRSQDEVPGAMTPGQATGLPYEAIGLAQEASRAAEAMRKQEKEEEEKREAAREGSKETSIAAQLAHDEKTRAIVDRIKAEKAGQAPEASNDRFVLGGNLDAEKAMFDKRLAELDAKFGPKFTEEKAAAEKAAASEHDDTAAKAKAWLAEKGIVAPPAKEVDAATPPAAAAAPSKPDPMSVEELLALSEKGAQLAGEPDAATVDESAVEADAAARSAVGGATEVSAAGIEQVVEYRVFKGNEQWRVRWQGSGEDGDTWESFRVLDTAQLQATAEALRV